jgi:uncharacterized membrane protein
MLVFILILLLIAAIFGVLGTVLEIALIIVLSVILAVCMLGLLGYYWFRHRVREFQRGADGHVERDRRWDELEGRAKDV